MCVAAIFLKKFKHVFLIAITNNYLIIINYIYI